MARGRRVVIRPEFSEVKKLFPLRIKDAAAVLGVSKSYLKSFCRKNGVSRWPGVKVRFLGAKLKKLALEAAARQRAPPEEAGLHRPRYMLVKDISKVLDEMFTILQIPIPPEGQLEHGGAAA